ncbi:hypothetical protein EVA_10346, partial [gut metagenome]
YFCQLKNKNSLPKGREQKLI